MFDIHRVELDWGGRKLVLETGKIARQADGAVVATYGETTRCWRPWSPPRAAEGIDFLPLTVNYQEKFYAAGRIPGGYFKREGRPTEKETLVSRLIDRPIRPLFAEGWRNETQVIVTTLSHDLENDPDIVAMVAASAALTLSGRARSWARSAPRASASSTTNTCSTRSSTRCRRASSTSSSPAPQDAVLMVESEAKELTEDVMLGAVMFGHRHFQPVIDAIIKLAEKAAKEPRELRKSPTTPRSRRKCSGWSSRICARPTRSPNKQERQDAVDAAKAKVMAHFFPEGPRRTRLRQAAGRRRVQGSSRPRSCAGTSSTPASASTAATEDGAPDRAEVGVLPRAHGSALFTRGETQALVVATLGTGEDEQWIDALHGTYKETFLLHYNFPPFSVGETGRMGGARPPRDRPRQARLARHPSRCCRRTTSSPTRSASSRRSPSRTAPSSMATVCGTSLALMDAGVPLKRPVAGIAMGLILEGERFAVLSDILGDEDHLGDMDFKVAGTERGVTSLQMDIKIAGITEEIMKVALAQAKDGRLHILGEMGKALTRPRRARRARAAHRGCSRSRSTRSAR